MEAVPTYGVEHVEQLVLAIKAGNLRAIKFYQRYGFPRSERFQRAIFMDDRYFDELQMFLTVLTRSRRAKSPHDASSGTSAQSRLNSAITPWLIYGGIGAPRGEAPKALAGGRLHATFAANCSIRFAASRAPP